MTSEYQEILLEIARSSIARALHGNRNPIPDTTNLPRELQEHRASFVTLTLHGQLRGCIGTLEAYQPLARDVAEHAIAAAFDDPRFPPLSVPEFEILDIHISILSESEEMQFTSQDDLLAQIRPGIDGLILQDSPYRGTFLPSVWDELPDPRLFLAHLKRKAGLPPNHWSPSLRIFRYTTESIPK